MAAFFFTASPFSHFSSFFVSARLFTSLIASKNNRLRSHGHRRNLNTATPRAAIRSPNQATSQSCIINQSLYGHHHLHLHQLQETLPGLLSACTSVLLRSSPIDLASRRFVTFPPTYLNTSPSSFVPPFSLSPLPVSSIYLLVYLLVHLLVHLSFLSCLLLHADTDCLSSTQANSLTLSHPCTADIFPLSCCFHTFSKQANSLIRTSCVHSPFTTASPTSSPPSPLLTKAHFFSCSRIPQP